MTCPAAADSGWHVILSAAKNLLLVAANSRAVDERAIFLLDGGGRIPDSGACERIGGS
jgi:hypothetical protein